MLSHRRLIPSKRHTPLAAAVLRLLHSCVLSDQYAFMQVAHLNAEARTRQCIEYCKLQQQLQRRDLAPAWITVLQEAVTVLFRQVLGRSASFAASCCAVVFTLHCCPAPMFVQWAEAE